MIGGTSFMVILLAGAGFNAAEGYGKVRDGGVITAKGVEFRPSWRDYWSIGQYYPRGEMLDLTSAKYHTLRIELAPGGHPTIKVKALDELEGYYYVVATSKLTVKKSNFQLIWTLICNRNLLNRDKIQNLYPNALQLLLISSQEQYRTQFQCPTFGKRRLNISFLPDCQSKPWTPLRGKLALYHLRMRPFKGLQLRFPNLAVNHSSEVAEEVLEIEGTTSANAKMIMTILLDKLQEQGNVNLNGCWRFFSLNDVAYNLLYALEYNDKWVIKTIRRLRQLHNKMDEPCDELGVKFEPHLLDYWHGIVIRRNRVVDYPYVVLTLDSKKKLDYKLYKILPRLRNIVLVAASKVSIREEAGGEEPDVAQYDWTWECTPMENNSGVLTTKAEAKNVLFKKSLCVVERNPDYRNYLLVQKDELKQLKTLECEKEGDTVKLTSNQLFVDEFKDEEYSHLADIVNTFATKADNPTMPAKLESLEQLLDMGQFDALTVHDSLARFATVFGEYERERSRSALVRQAKQCIAPKGLFSTIFQTSSPIV